MTFGQWLQQHRKKLGLNQAELAERAECTRGYISSLERDVVESKSGRPIQPSVEFIDKLARALGVPLAEARARAGYASPETIRAAGELEPRLLYFLRALPPERQQELVSYAEWMWQRYGGDALRREAEVKGKKRKVG